MKPVSALAQLIEDIKSVLRMDPPAVRVVQHGGAIVTAGHLKGHGIDPAEFIAAALSAGLVATDLDYGNTYLVKAA